MKLLARYLSLAFLSAIVAEFLLGDQWLAGVASAPQQVAELLLYAAFYGSAAVLIREVARRTGRGWPTMLVLALAFGVIEEGLVDQSLFNPNFASAHLLHFGFIPALGIAGPWTIFVLSLHVIWSIGSPIAIAEGIFPEPLPGRVPVEPQVQASWLRPPTMVAAVVLYGTAGFAVYSATVVRAHFAASAVQLIVSAVIAAVLIAVGLVLPRRRPRGIRPFGSAAATSLVVTSAYIGLDRIGASWSPWLVAGSALVLLSIGVALAAALRLDVLGLAAGAVLTYSWVGLSKAVPLGLAPALEQCVLVAVVLAAIVLAVKRRAAAAVRLEK